MSHRSFCVNYSRPQQHRICGKAGKDLVDRDGREARSWRRVVRYRRDFGSSFLLVILCRSRFVGLPFCRQLSGTAAVVLPDLTADHLLWGEAAIALPCPDKPVGRRIWRCHSCHHHGGINRIVGRLSRFEPGQFGPNLSGPKPAIVIGPCLRLGHVFKNL